MNQNQKSYLLDLSLLSIGLFIFFFIFLGNMPLHTPDEARYSLISFQMFQEHQYLVPKINGVGFLDKPPLFYYAQILMLKLFGNSEVTLRLPSVIASLFSCLMIYITARKLFNRRTALNSTVILANFPLYFLMSHYANLDMMVASFINCALCCFILAQQKSTMNPRRGMWGCYISIALAMLTKGLIAVAFPCCIVFLYCLIYRKKIKLFLIDGVVIFSIIVLPWFVLMHNEVQDFSYYYFVIQHFYRYLSKSFNNQQPLWFYSALIGACSLPWLFFLTSKQWSLKTSNKGFFAISFGFILLFFSIPSSKPIGYILPAFPPLALLLGHALSQHLNTKRFILLSITATTVGFMLCYPWPILKEIYHALIPIAFTLIISGGIGLSFNTYFLKINSKQKSSASIQNNVFMLLLCLTMMFLNLNGLQLIQSLEHESIKPITHYLQKHTPKNYTIAMYYTFYYDLPYYLPNRTILAVDNWKKGLFKGDLLIEQFALGMQYHAPKTFISKTEFMNRWQNAQQSMYVLTNRQHSRTLLKQGGKLLLKHHGIYLITPH